MQSEIEKNVPRGMDINPYVNIGDKGVKTSQRQMHDPSGGYVFMTYDAASNKLSRKNATASPAATPHQAPMNVAKPAEQARSTVQQAIEKLQRENLLRLDCTGPDAKAWIAPVAWISCDAQQKENFTKGLAAYCHPEYPSIWILDKQSGRKLASYGPFRGFEAY
jgi:hypothetical protein